ncbi:hypothetical protein X975_23457, partial [Stegodyphus mimosarum]
MPQSATAHESEEQMMKTNRYRSQVLDKANDIYMVFCPYLERNHSGKRFLDSKRWSYYSPQSFGMFRTSSGNNSTPPEIAGKSMLVSLASPDFCRSDHACLRIA